MIIETGCLRKHLNVWLRMGEFRAMYFVEGPAVFVTDLFTKKKESAYREN
jgi:phage-related protein